MPTVGTWRAMSLSGAPPFTAVMGGVWTGSELAVLEPDPNHGAPLSLNAYDPILDSWRAIPVPSNVAFSPRMNPYLGVVTGKLIVYGGYADPVTTGFLTDGWIVDLSDLTWTPMAPGPQLWDAGDGFPRVFADGSRAVFVPVSEYIDVKDVAVAAYDLSTQTWETVSSPSSTNGSFGCIAPAWNGGQALCQASVFLYTVTTSPLAIKPFPSLFVPMGTSNMTFSPIGSMFLGLGPGAVPPAEELYWLDPTRQIWSAPAEVSGLGNRAATVNSQALFWGMGPLTTDAAGRVNVSFVAGVFDPAAGVWSSVTCVGAPTWTAGGVTVATPSGLIVFGGADSPTGNAILEL